MNEKRNGIQVASPISGGMPPCHRAASRHRSDLDDAITSSIRRIMTAASVALDIACVFTRSGSTTPVFNISTGFPLNTTRRSCVRLRVRTDCNNHIDWVKPGIFGKRAGDNVHCGP